MFDLVRIFLEVRPVFTVDNLYEYGTSHLMVFLFLLLQVIVDTKNPPFLSTEIVDES